ncbi:hypothetical protein Tco_1229499 [Tanacetum coccineum]
MHKMKDEYGDGDVTLYPTQVFNVNNWALKPNQHEEPPFTDHMLALCSVDKPVVFKASKLSSNVERVSQGIKPKAQLRHKKHLTSSKQSFVSSKEETKGGSSKAPISSKTGHSKKRKKSSSTMNSNPSQPPVSTPVDTGMHKEDQQATGGPTSLGVTSEARSNPQLSSGNDASAVSTAEADPEKSAPSTEAHVLLEDLVKLVSNVQPSFKDLDSPEDDPVIVVDDSDEDEEGKVHTTTNDETKYTSVLKSLSPSSLPTELKDLPSKFNELTEEDPEREFRSSRKHFKTLSLDELRSPDFNLLFDQEYSEEEVAETMAETMEQYMSKTRADYGSGVARPKIEDNDNFEIKGQFLKELQTNTFNGSDHEDANEHIEKVLKIVDIFHIPKITIDHMMLRAFPMSLTGAASRWLNQLQESYENLYQAWERFKELLMKCPQHYLTDMQEVILFYNGLGIPTRQIIDSRGAIPSKTAADAKVAIQEMVEYSQKWHNGTSWSRSTETSDGLAAIQAQLNNLGREIKKVNEKVFAAQVGCEQCKGPHYTKDFQLKEEGKILKEAYTRNLVDLFKEEDIEQQLQDSINGTMRILLTKNESNLWKIP